MWMARRTKGSDFFGRVCSAVATCNDYERLHSNSVRPRRPVLRYRRTSGYSCIDPPRLDCSTSHTYPTEEPPVSELGPSCVSTRRKLHAPSTDASCLSVVTTSVPTRISSRIFDRSSTFDALMVTQRRGKVMAIRANIRGWSPSPAAKNDDEHEHVALVDAMMDREKRPVPP